MGQVCGGGISDKDAAKRNREIESFLRSEAKDATEEVKILLLGTGESGKSTVAKQMKIIHLAGFTEEEKICYKAQVFNNVLMGISTILIEARNRGLPVPDTTDNIIAISQRNNIDYTVQLANTVAGIWAQPQYKQLVAEQSQSFTNPWSDSAAFFLDDCTRFCANNYVPSDLDILRVRVKTTGIVEIHFSIRRKKFRLVDVGGQRNERKKWIHCFEGVTTILYCVALSDYDMTLVEDPKVNRMQESLHLFQDLLENQYFLSTNFILFLNKKDIFKEKIKRIDLNICFPMYNDGLDYEKAGKYIQKKFVDCNKGHNNRKIYPHFTCATDTQNITKIFRDVEQMFLNDVISDLGVPI